MSSSFRKGDKCIRSLFIVVATVQGIRTVRGFSFHFIYFALIPRYIDILDEVK